MPNSQVIISSTCYLVPKNGTVHCVRRDGTCACGGRPQQSCAANPPVQDYLASGEEKSLGRHPDTWPETWTTIPSHCPVCNCPTISDRCLDSRAGPGWRCSLEPLHFWQVRMEPLRRYLRANPQQLRYPWTNCTLEERSAWLEEHYHPPRLVASTKEGGARHAREKTPAGQGRVTSDPHGHSGRLARMTLAILALRTCLLKG